MQHIPNEFMVFQAIPFGSTTGLIQINGMVKIDKGCPAQKMEIETDNIQSLLNNPKALKKQSEGGKMV